MAWVRLEDLFARDKNFYGSLDANVKVPIEIPDDTIPMVTEEFKVQVNSFSGKVKIADLMDTEFNAPEWKLLPDGILVNFSGLYIIDGRPQFVDFLRLDYREHLRTLPKETLEEIAKHFWKKENKSKFTKNFL